MRRESRSAAQSIDVTPVQEVGRKLVDNVGKVIVGKDEVIRLAVVALLCEGHILAEDVPGVGKTMMARALAASLGCSFNRIQFTPDLLPSDVTGVNVYNQKNQEFTFRPGPVVTNILLADEINRATPRTQSALLECMEERQLTVDGVSRELPRPFLVLATQNPVEYEGTFPLPEAQIDRFLVRLSIGYPGEQDEEEIVIRQQRRHPIHDIKQVVGREELLTVQTLVREVYVEDSVREYLVKLVRSTRTHPDVSLGASPRGSISLYRTAQALAALEGRDYVLPDDVKAMAGPTLAHRLIIRPESQLRGRTGQSVINDLLQRIPVVLEAGEEG
ncbi:MAG TPA: MoxR family ATPase [Firmicutes bacterium]|nr:MoxR family ATPase [Bacillota bacterium]